MEKSKLKTLLEYEGFKNIEEVFTECEFGMRVGVPAICCNTDVDCDYVEDMEPDQDQGWCPECEANTLKSAYILAGLI